MVPDASGDSHDIHHAADSRYSAADDRREILVSRDVDSGRVGSRGRFADGAEIKPEACAADEEGHRGWPG